jgi:hypothetical protein
MAEDVELAAQCIAKVLTGNRSPAKSATASYQSTCASPPQL